MGNIFSSLVQIIQRAGSLAQNISSILTSLGSVISVIMYYYQSQHTSDIGIQTDPPLDVGKGDFEPRLKMVDFRS